MEKALVVSILERTYLDAHNQEKEEQKTKLLPENWEDLPIDDKMILLDKAISSGEIIKIETNEIGEGKVL